MSRQAFADDIFLWRAGSFRDGVIHPGLRMALRMVERWSLYWRVQFSAKKCECICFREKNVHITQTFQARLYGELLPHVSEMRYLGVWFDETLNWGR